MTDFKIVNRIKNKYGKKLLREYYHHYRIGVPEKFWEVNCDQWLIDAITEKIDQEKFIAVFGKTIYDSSLVLASVLKSNKILSKSSQFLNFSDLMVSYTDMYNKENRSNILNLIESKDVICISGIMIGKIFDKYSEDFLYLLNGVVNSRTSKAIILGMEKCDNEDEYKEYYGEVYELIQTILFWEVEV